MARFVRIGVIVVAKQSVVELDDGEGIIAASSDGERVALVTAKDVTVEPGAPSAFASFSDG